MKTLPMAPDPVQALSPLNLFYKFIIEFLCNSFSHDQAPFPHDIENSDFKCRFFGVKNEDTRNDLRVDKTMQKWQEPLNPKRFWS